jgi:tetratricopeptide (TPR) repeat protein
MTTQVTTQAEAINELRNAVIEYETTGAVNDDLKTSVAHSLRDIQVRDFILGITAEGHSTELVANFIQHLSTTAITEQLAPINASLASYLYRLGNTEGAYECLNKATEADPKYSLTILLRRVFGSGWPAEAFEAMTRELHPKVVSGIEESECELLIS